MAHRLLERYPKLDGNFLFLDVNVVIPKYLYPLLPACAEMEDPKYRWKVWNDLKASYKGACDEDFRFYRQGQPCDEGQAEQFWMRTPLTSRDGRPIWLYAERNTQPDRSRWFVRKVTLLEPAGEQAAPAPGTAAAPAAPEAPAGAGAEQPLLERYPDFFSLVYFNHNKIQEYLVPLTGDSTLTRNKVQDAFRLRYKQKGLEALQFLKGGQEADPDQADTLLFSTGYTDTEGREIRLECARNHKKDMEPWFARFFNTEGWKATGQLRTFYDKVYVISKQLEVGLHSLTRSHSDLLESPPTKVAHIAKRFVELQPGQILYFKGFYRTSDENDADQMCFPTGYFSPEGEEIMLRCKRSRGDRAIPWVSRRFYLPSQNPFYGQKPGKWLFAWAKFKSTNPMDISEELYSLKARLLKGERWSLREGGSDLSILRNYLAYTFVRLWRENKILYSDDGIAAFNTGLVDPTYEYIYAMFLRNPQQNSCREWQFWGFCVAGQDPLGKTLSDQFYPMLPQPARYFDPDKPIYYSFDDTLSIKAQLPDYNADHILLERTYRLPMKFLRKYAGLAPGLEEKLDEAEQLPPDDQKASRRVWREISSLIRGSDTVYRSMKGDVDKAVEIAVKRAAWNYRTVIPYYDPTNDKICLLLPISLTTDSTPDAAMVLEPSSKDKQRTHYQGHTVITLAMAYANSRLVCRPESDWLNIDAVMRTGDLSQYDDDDGDDEEE